MAAKNPVQYSRGLLNCLKQAAHQQRIILIRILSCITGLKSCEVKVQGNLINCHYLHLACGYCFTFGKHLCCTCEDMPQLHAFRYVLCPCSLQITSSACIMLQTLATDMARPSPVALFGASGKLSASHLLLLSTNLKNALKHLETFSNTLFHQLRLSRVGASRVSCAIRTSKAIPASGQQPLRRVTYWQDWTENSSQ